MNISLAGANWIAVIVAVLINMAAGALWYSPVLFAKPWMAEVKMTMEQIRANSAAARHGYIVAVVASIVIAVAMAMLGQATGAATGMDGILLGLLTSIGFVGAAFSASYAFEQKTLRHFLITAGYSVVGNALIGVLLTVWR